jgi:hypothetical protein
VGNGQAAARRGGAEVCRANEPVRARQVVGDLAPPPDMVAKCDDVRAGGEQPVGEARRDPSPVRGVLAVDDAEADLELVAQGRQPLLDQPAAGDAEDVADEEDPQGIPSDAAARTSSSTWLPASWV